MFNHEAAVASVKTCALEHSLYKLNSALDFDGEINAA